MLTMKFSKDLGASTNGHPGGGGGVGTLTSHAGGRVTSKTAPARLEGFEEDDIEDTALFKVLTNNSKEHIVVSPLPVCFSLIHMI